MEIPPTAKTTERIPTFDSVGDVDEAWNIANSYLLQRMSPEEVDAWWYEPNPAFGGKIPATAKHARPDKVFEFILTNFR